MKKKLFSIILAVIMVVGLIPATALTVFADEGDNVINARNTILKKYGINTDALSYNEDGMMVFFDGVPITADKSPYSIPDGSGTVSLSDDGHTLTLDHVQFDAETPSSNPYLFVRADQEDTEYNILVNGDCSIAYQETPMTDTSSMLFAFAQNNTVNIKGVSDDAALKGNDMIFTQYDPVEEVKTNTFNFENLDIYGRSYEDVAFLGIADYINFTNSVLDCYTAKNTTVVSLNDINYGLRETPSDVEFNNCKLNLENASKGLVKSGEVGTLYIDAFFSSHDCVALNNCDANIVVDHMEMDETRAMTLFDAELTVNGGKLFAAVKDPQDAEQGILAAAIQVPVFKALNGADVDLIAETQDDGGLSTGIIYAKKILIQDSDLYIKATGNRAHGLYYFYQENNLSQEGTDLQWEYKGGKIDELQNEERGVDIINSTTEIITKGASADDKYLVNAVSGKRIYFEKSLIKLQSVSTDGGLAIPVIAYDFNSNCGIFMSNEVPVTPDKIKIAERFFKEVNLDSYYLTDEDGNIVTEVILKPESVPVTGNNDTSKIWLAIMLISGAVMAGVGFYLKKLLGNCD